MEFAIIIIRKKQWLCCFALLLALQCGQYPPHKYCGISNQDARIIEMIDSISGDQFKVGHEKIQIRIYRAGSFKEPVTTKEFQAFADFRITDSTFLCKVFRFDYKFDLTACSTFVINKEESKNLITNLEKFNILSKPTFLDSECFRSNGHYIMKVLYGNLNLLSFNDCEKYKETDYSKFLFLAKKIIAENSGFEM